MPAIVPPLLRHNALAATRRASARLLSLAWALIALPGCGQRIVLGSECDDLEIQCDIETAAPPVERGEPDAADDAGSGPQDDAATTPPPVPGADAGEFQDELQFENPNFERNGGLDGDLILQEIFTTLFEAVVPTQPIFASVPGWYACMPFTVTSNTPADSNAPSGHYLTFVRNALTLSTPSFSSARQKLPLPMRAGKPVHLLVDVISRTEGDNNLYLEVRGDPKDRASFLSQCGVNGTVIGRSERIEDSSDWKPVCVSFTPTEDYYTLLLVPNAEGNSQASSPTLLLDTLRVVSECPES